MAKIKISKKRVCPRPRGLVPQIFQNVNLSSSLLVSYNLHDTEVFLYPSLALTRLKDNFPICKIFLGKQFLINNCKVYLNWRDLTPVATKSPVFVFSPFPLLPLPLFLPPLGFLLCLAAPPVLPPLEFVFLPFHSPLLFCQDMHKPIKN